MDANEVVMYMEQRNHRDMIFEFLAKSVRQPGKAANLHTHGQILAFNGVTPKVETTLKCHNWH